MGCVRPPAFAADVWVGSVRLGDDASGHEQFHEMREVLQVRAWRCAFPYARPLRLIAMANAGSILTQFLTRETECGVTLAHPTARNVLLCGGFACDSGAPPLEYAERCALRDSWSLASQPWVAEGTYPASSGTWKLDRVLVSPCRGVEVRVPGPRAGGAASYICVRVHVCGAGAGARHTYGVLRCDDAPRRARARLPRER